MEGRSLGLDEHIGLCVCGETYCIVDFTWVNILEIGHGDDVSSLYGWWDNISIEGNLYTYNE